MSGFRASRPPPSRGLMPPPSHPRPKELRRDWVRAIEVGGDLARAGLKSWEGEPDPAIAPGSLANLAAALRHLSPQNFPVEFATARTAAAAFLLVAGQFANPATPPASRALLASILAASAGVLDGLMADLRREEASRVRGMMGERDE